MGKSSPFFPRVHYFRSTGWPFSTRLSIAYKRRGWLRLRYVLHLLSRMHFLDNRTLWQMISSIEKQDLHLLLVRSHLPLHHPRASYNIPQVQKGALENEISFSVVSVDTADSACLELRREFDVPRDARIQTKSCIDGSVHFVTYLSCCVLSHLFEKNGKHISIRNSYVGCC